MYRRQQIEGKILKGTVDFNQKRKEQKMST